MKSARIRVTGSCQNYKNWFLKKYKFNRQLGMKKSSRNWTKDQDRMLEQLMQQNNGQRKLKWEEVAVVMHQRIQNCQKTGKQCRERWHNHLAPELNNSSEWTREQNQKLFGKHAELGNKWAKIATFLQGRTDNCVKNHFYSTLRRGMRKVNNFIHDQKKQRGAIKEFKPDVLTKILIVADGDPEQKLNAKNNAQILSKTIKDLLIQVSLETDQETYDEDVINKVIALILDFNKNCKKRKGKKKATSNQKLNEDEKEEEDEFSQAIEQQAQQSLKIENTLQKNSKLKIEQSDSSSSCKKEENRRGKTVKTKKTQKEAQLKENEQFNEQQNNISTKQEPIIPAQNKNLIKQVKEIDLVASGFEKEFGNNIFHHKRTINRSLSTEGDLAELVPNTLNFPGPFSCPKGDFVEPLDFFKSSAVGFSFTTAGEGEGGTRQFLAESAIGIKKGDALNNLSAFSEKNSFLKMEGDKGTFEPDIFGQLRMSNASNFQGFGLEKPKPDRNNK